MRGARAKSRPSPKSKHNPRLGVTCAREDKYFANTPKSEGARAATVARIASKVPGGHPSPLSKLTVVRAAARIRPAKIRHLSELRTMQIESSLGLHQRVPWSRERPILCCNSTGSNDGILGQAANSPKSHSEDHQLVNQSDHAAASTLNQATASATV